MISWLPRPPDGLDLAMQRRSALTRLLTLAAASSAPAAWAATPPKVRVDVWKDAGCGCCQDWIAHIERHGFSAVLHDEGNAAARHRLGMPARLGSCHTARVEGYVIEGHVPAVEIHRLLKLRPVALGLAVPGMPVGSPGMDGPEYKGRKDPFDVLLVQADGHARVWQAYR